MACLRPAGLLMPGARQAAPSLQRASLYVRPSVFGQHLPKLTRGPGVCGVRGSSVRTNATLLPASSALLPGDVLSSGTTAIPLFELSEGLETPIQLIYLLTLLGFLSVGAYLVVRQVLIRRELDEAAKGLGERIRTGEATCEDYYELGVILARKKLFTQATKNLEKAKKLWDGEESELAQVHNALGFCYFSMERADLAIQEYRRAVELQPGYVTAWNNLGDALESDKKWKDALQAYQEALTYAPNNQIARQRAEYCRGKVERMPSF